MNAKLTIINCFFQIELYLTVKSSNAIVRCYGITKDPKTNNFMMVMEYASCGSLRQNLDKNFNSLNWNNKLFNLYFIAYGLNEIHEKGLIHHDFHSGNILIALNNGSYVSDLGLCRPINVSNKKIAKFHNKMGCGK
jgi:serine/threonine protein kinase